MEIFVPRNFRPLQDESSLKVRWDESAHRGTFVPRHELHEELSSSVISVMVFQLSYSYTFLSFFSYS